MRFHCILLFSAGLGEFKLRDLNDEINKLLREKIHWEERITELGGPDYRVGPCWSFVEKTSVKRSMKRKVCSNFQMQMYPPSRGI